MVTRDCYPTLRNPLNRGHITLIQTEDATIVLSQLSSAHRLDQTARKVPSVRAVLAWLTCFQLIGAVLACSAAADAPRIDTAEPASGDSVTASPDVIRITFDEPIATDGDPAAITLIGSAGVPQSLGSTTLSSADARTIEAPVSEPLAAGTYVVQWTIVPDGAARASTGTYAFRVAAASIPGGATDVDTLPDIWAIVTRVLTLVGLALSLGGFTLARLVTNPSPSDASQRRQWLTLAGALLALVGTLAEPVLAFLQRDDASGFTDLVAAYPAWWPRTLALIGLVGVTAVLATRVPGHAGSGRLLWAAGVVFGAVALAATSLATVSAQSIPADPFADGLLIVLQVVLVILAGIAIHLVLATPPHRASRVPTTSDADAGAAHTASVGSKPARRKYRWLMIALAGIGLVAVVGLSALSPTGLAGLLNGLSGWLLVAVAILLVAILALSLLARGANEAVPLRGVVALATLTLVGVAILALSPPPGKAMASGALAAVNIVAPIDQDVAGQPGLVHLMVQPAAPGENTFLTWLTNADGVVLTAGEQPSFSLAITALGQTTPSLQLAPEPVAPGQLAAVKVSLPQEGWWQVDVTVTPPDREATIARFYLVLPDPNVTGTGPEPPSSGDARGVFDRGLAAMTNLRNVQFRTLIGSGSGTFGQSDIIINDPGDASLRTYQDASASYETVIVGNQQWLRQGDGPWTERPAGYIFTPSEWGMTYQHATGFMLGPLVELEGETTQVVSFWLPRQENPRQEPAWFTWWVGTETGQVHRETMISTQHYMVYDFTGFNQPVKITPPETTP